VAGEGEELRFAGAAVGVGREEPFYVGIGVCAHNKDVTETAVFANVKWDAALPASPKPAVLYSTLETQALASTDRRVVYSTPTRLEAPNWLRDGQTLIYNSGGQIYPVPVAGGKPEGIDTGLATRRNTRPDKSPGATPL